MIRFLVQSLIRAVGYGIIGALCAGGLLYIFWGIFEGTLDTPFQELSRMEQIIFIAAPIVEFLAIAVMVLVLDLKKRRNPATIHSNPS